MMLQHDVFAVAGSSLAHAGKVFQSLKGDLVHSPMPEKFSGP
jgi:hypothetical protein